ncbi:hypothetical protein SDC9_176396 [bioreactor metagenome]|uniref:Putative zinc-ribbon domain-containing protein n=1 Tax=bioreactor metagenome TaxID=1076179 RepID=A0A645GRR3_9ZZZZ
MDLGVSTKERIESLFTQEPELQQSIGEEEEEMLLSQIPELAQELIAKLNFHDIYSVEEFVNLTHEEIEAFGDITPAEVSRIHEVLSEYVDIVEEEQEDGSESEFACPECGHPISTDMTVCPNCHVGLSFEEVEMDEE